MDHTTRISVIIVNWNGAQHLRVCLPSLLAQTFKSFEIIVVDNGSTDESEQVTKELGAKWLALGRNVGLAPALNRGASTAVGEMLLFINNDMRFDEGFIAALANPLQLDKTLFAADGMQFNWDGTDRVHLAARLTTNRNTGPHSTELVPGLHFYQQDHGQETKVFMGSAACMLVRRSLFEELNGFDDRLPLGYEDVEICWRAWLRGWPTIFVPGATCWHRVGASSRSREGANLNYRGILIGRLLFSTKLLPTRYAFGTWVLSVAGLAKDILRGLQFIKARIEIMLRIAILIPQLLEEKKELFHAAATTPATHLQSMLQLGRRLD